MTPVEQYLRDLSEIRSTGGGTREASYYGPLEHLFDAIGSRLKPRGRLPHKHLCCANSMNSGLTT
jgi:hypothetical protein